MAARGASGGVARAAATWATCAVMVVSSCAKAADSAAYTSRLLPAAPAPAADRPARLTSEERGKRAVLELEVKAKVEVEVEAGVEAAVRAAVVGAGRRTGVAAADAPDVVEDVFKGDAPGAKVKVEVEAGKVAFVVAAASDAATAAAAFDGRRRERVGAEPAGPETAVVVVVVVGDVAFAEALAAEDALAAANDGWRSRSSGEASGDRLERRRRRKGSILHSSDGSGENTAGSERCAGRAPSCPAAAAGPASTATSTGG